MEIKYPIQTVSVIDGIGRTHNFLARKFPKAGKGAYELVNNEGDRAPHSLTINKDNKINIILYDGLWVEEKEVTSLVILTGEKLIDMGKLLSIS